MADSRRSRPADGVAGCEIRGAVRELLARALPNGGKVGVALSGGRDSVALLDAAASVAAASSIRLVAFHVHHGLSPNADRWSRLCRDICANRDIAFAMREVQVPLRARSSLEAAARDARYAALAALAGEHRVDAMLLGHHADDQAETVLLQLLRGAGPRGLAAMSGACVDRGVRWLRPFLSLSRDALNAYVREHRLDYVDDESNKDRRFRRNALRSEVLPALRAIAPGCAGALARAAGHQAEAAALLDDLAELDAQHALDGETLAGAALSRLSPPRARNLLRWFLRRQGLRAPSSARLAEMLHQLCGARADARVAIAHDGVQLGVHRGRIVVHRAPPPAYIEPWSGATSVRLPHGTLLFTATRGTGIATRWLCTSAVTLRAGTPGERLRIGEHASRRLLADLLREAGVPRWDRASLPRLYCGDALAAVPHAGVDAAFAARAGEAAFALDWRPG